jgi:flagella basal body P-ring formation protein FlgA
MRVMVVRREAMADIRLRGTALGTARTGERVAVRAGLGNSIVHGIVRGPGVVELAVEKIQ